MGTMRNFLDPLIEGEIEQLVTKSMITSFCRSGSAEQKRKATLAKMEIAMVHHEVILTNFLFGKGKMFSLVMRLYWKILTKYISYCSKYTASETF